MNELLKKKVEGIPYWYHKIELPDGIITNGWSPICAEKYAIPDDMTGMRVLDVGAWDGYWTFEALRRGAKEVVAIDDFSDNLGSIERAKEWKTFDICKQAFGYKGNRCRRQTASVYQICEELFGRFDVVFFFGTIYHLKNPMLALERISGVCDGELYMETAICDDFSPYRGGLDRGYHENDMIAEFYPEKEYGKNSSNWWVATLQTYAYMVQANGFDNVSLWRLTENPKGVEHCRGFVHASKKEVDRPNVMKNEDSLNILRKREKVRGIMSVPRIGFIDNLFCVADAVYPLKIPMIKLHGVFWGQMLEKGMQMQIDAGAEFILTIDYDTVFRKEDLQELIEIMRVNPEIDALVPAHVGRAGKGMLCTVKGKSGLRMLEVPMENFAGETSKVPLSTGHFGLTLIRVKSLLKMGHPWFLAETDRDGMWGRDRTDADIYFWRKFVKAGNNVRLANRVVIGHLEQVVTWPDKEMRPVYQVAEDYDKNGKPKEVWN